MIRPQKSNRKETKNELVSFMTKFEKSLLVLAAVFLLALGLVSRWADRPLPLRAETAVPAERSAAPDGLAFLNEADAAELCSLPGVGEVIAERIIDKRPFESPEDLLCVEGIGESTMEKIYEYLEGN